MNEFEKRVEAAFEASPTVTHVFRVTIQLPELDARNEGDCYGDIEDILREKIEENLLFTRSITVERE